jgi:dihydrofolate synthase/folylpolyglutamate synthase
VTQFGSDLILARLQTLHPKSIDLSLGRIERLLERLGHPQRRLPPVVHIAGTNGKGSTLAMLDAMLTAAGKRVHRYISPHLVNFNERILLVGRAIEEGLLAEVLDICERANRDDPITFFEITTAAAILAFGRVDADLLLLETGLGGRLDATNVVDQPAMTLISPISMDHEAYLGRTIAAIAGEKAGIIKRKVPVLVGPQAPEALAVLDARADAMSAPIAACGREWSFGATCAGFALRAPDVMLRLPPPGLRGTHQLQNAALAAIAGHRLGLAGEPIAAGIATAAWPARLQRLPQAAFPYLASRPVDVWLDGGHNPAAGIALAQSLPEIAAGRPVELVVGMLESKDTGAFLTPMRGLVRHVHAVAVPGESSSRSADEVAAVAQSLGMAATAAPSVEHALKAIGRTSHQPTMALICGSLYLAGYVLRRLP